MKAIFISSVHSDSNASPGLGTAISLRARPSLTCASSAWTTPQRLRDYTISFSTRPSSAPRGAYRLRRPPETRRGPPSRSGRPGISGPDVEAAWLAERGLGPRVPVYPPATFAAVAKPSRIVVRSKHPSGMPELSRRLASAPVSAPAAAHLEVSDQTVARLAVLAEAAEDSTPACFLETDEVTQTIGPYGPCG